jgi:hypothetical protein
VASDQEVRVNSTDALIARIEAEAPARAAAARAAAFRERCERIATAVMAGFAANPHPESPWFRHPDSEPEERRNPAVMSVVWADALIAALDRDPEAGK